MTEPQETTTNDDKERRLPTDSNDYLDPVWASVDNHNSGRLLCGGLTEATGAKISP